VVPAAHSAKITAPALGLGLGVRAARRHPLHQPSRPGRRTAHPHRLRLSGPFTAASLDGFEAQHRALTQGFATDPTLVVLGLGPAGSGKTAAMQGYVHDAHQAGRWVVPLAASAASAAAWPRKLGMPAENLDDLLWEYTDGPAAQALTADHPVPRRRAAFALRPGDVVMVDEAGMAGTFTP
jgi:AAA domain